MNPIKQTALRAYMALTQPIRWYWGHSLASANRYPVSILFYHRVSDFHPNPWTISTREFERQIEWLRQRFEIITLAEAQHRIQVGNSRPAVAITFDDGYADNCLTAIPYLVNHQIPATYFVNNENIKTGQPFPHDVERGIPLAPNGIESLKLMHRSGIEIGAHSRTHRDLGQTTDPEILFDELVVARDELEDLIEGPIKYFAFPYGQFENLNDEVFQLAKMYGFSGVCSAYGGFNSIGSDPFHLQRIHGDPEFLRIKNWLTLDPRMALQRSYPLPEWDNIELENPEPSPESVTSNQSDQISHGKPAECK